MEIKLYKGIETPMDMVLLYGSEVAAKAMPLKKDEWALLQERKTADAESLLVFDRLPHHLYIQNYNSELPSESMWEHLRRSAAKLQQRLVDEGVREVYLCGRGVIPEEMLAFVEGLHMANYRFDRYKTKKDKSLDRIWVDESIVSQSMLDENLVLWRNIDRCRDWVNEPVMALNAARFADELKARADELHVDCTVLGQKQIEALKMGGLLAVNKGSVDEARFVILEYKAEQPVNERPIALVGKGVMYDTGGLNIKPDDYMQEMKSDMAGAATMASVLFAAAENQLPVHIVALLPLTDSRPGGNAYAADDILTMYDGTTVEVINTDAEGRLLLADAVAYSNRFNPCLIIDAATLTGAAVRAIGTFGIAAMQQGADNAMSLLKIVGNKVYERLVEFPFWEEYDKLIESEVADIKNCGIAQAGAITAGKFVAHFAKQPYIHLDIAGVAFFSKRESFYGVGASGYGIRLLYAFLQTCDVMNLNK
ncbi:MAG: leucyl aminopeptidase family protein [Bacteroidales bacterium]|nr:leucyl aminopeptidase family protein [Bacteroidales bacterium]